MNVEIAPKRLELLHELVPTASVMGGALVIGTDAQGTRAQILALLGEVAASRA